MFLSVCILTKNEESSIYDCLNSVSQIADEIIILDSFSVDATVEISKKFTSQIYYLKWIDDFSYARNYCISKASGKWILVIDADEIFGYNKKFLKKLKRSKEFAYGIIRQEIYRLKENQKKVKYPVAILRLFRNCPEIKFRNKIHERIDDYFIENNQLINLNNDCEILHNIFRNEVGKVKKKQSYYLKLIDEHLNTVKDDNWMLFQKVKTKYNLNLIDGFEQDLNYLIDSPNSTHKIKIASIALLSLHYKNEGRFNEASIILKKALKIQKTTLIYCFLGDIYYARKEYIRAIFCYLRIKTNTRNLNYESSMYMISYLNFSDKIYKICSSLFSLNLLNLSKFILIYNTKVLKADTYYLLSIIYLKKRNRNMAKLYLNKAIENDRIWIKPKELLKALNG